MTGHKIVKQHDIINQASACLILLENAQGKDQVIYKEHYNQLISKLKPFDLTEEAETVHPVINKIINQHFN